MRRLRVLLLVHEDLVPPESLEGSTEKEIAASFKRPLIIVFIMNLRTQVGVLVGR